MIAEDLPPQTSVNPAAADYCEISLLCSSPPPFTNLVLGLDPAQRLDIYLLNRVPQPGAKLPVFLFWHGSDYNHGHKEWCGFMALAATPAIFVAANCRLLPVADSEQKMDHARSSLHWMLDHIAHFGGDPRRLVVGGHSTEASIAARVELDADRRRAAGIADGAISTVLLAQRQLFGPRQRAALQSLPPPACGPA